MLRVAFLSALLVACGSDPVDDSSTGGGSGGSGGGSGGTGGTGGSPLCQDGPTTRDVCESGPGYAEPEVLIDAGSVSAVIVDEAGEPLVDLMVFVCGTRVCSMPEYTGADGAVAIASPEPMAKPAFKFGDGLAVGRFAALLPENAGETDLGTVATPRLPSPGACLTPGTTVESAGVRLTLPDDAQIEVLPIDYPEEADRTFRAAELPLELAPPGLDGDEELDAIFALAPTDAAVCPPASIELPNTPNYEPGSEVDILIHGTDVEEGWAPYGGWRAVARGRVDDAGKHIQTIEGGLPVIANVGVRLR